MQPTMSQDGTPRATIQTKHRVGMLDLQQAAQDVLLSKCDWLEDPKPATAKLKKYEIEERLRHLLYSNGVDFHWRVVENWDMRDELYNEAALEVVNERVESLFPEFR